jgi:hypothetical protein
VYTDSEAGSPMEPRASRAFVPSQNQNAQVGAFDNLIFSGAQVVPEPKSILLVVTALLGIMVLMRRRTAS